MKIQLKHENYFELDAMAPYDFELTIGRAIRIRQNFPPLEDEFSEGIYWTTLRTSNIVGAKVRSVGTVDNPMLLCSLFADGKLENKEEKEALESIRWMIGANENISNFYKIAEENKVLQGITKELNGLRMLSQGGLFRSLITGIFLQNAPVRRSIAMISYLVERYGMPVTFEKRTYYAPLNPNELAKAKIEELREGKLGYRAGYIKRISADFEPTMEKKLEMTPTEGAKKELMKLKGVGECTAEFALLGSKYKERRRYDVFPVDSWSSRLYLNLFAPSKGLSKLSNDKVCRLAREHANKTWGRWKGLVLEYTLLHLL